MDEIVLEVFLLLILFQIKHYLVDFVIHFSMDRIKASPNILGRYKYPNPAYWYSLGADQSVHHLTHYQKSKEDPFL